jgi:hypothetical protein
MLFFCLQYLHFCNQRGKRKHYVPIHMRHSAFSSLIIRLSYITIIVFILNFLLGVNVYFDTGCCVRQLAFYSLLLVSLQFNIAAHYLIPFGSLLSSV